MGDGEGNAGFVYNGSDNHSGGGLYQRDIFEQLGSDNHIGKADDNGSGTYGNFKYFLLLTVDTAGQSRKSIGNSQA